MKIDSTVAGSLFTSRQDQSEEVISSQRSSPCSHDPMKLKVSKEDSYELRKLPLKRVFNTLRFLLTKVSLEGKISEKEELILYLGLDKCLQSRDPSWIIKNKGMIYKIQFLIQCYQRTKFIGVDIKSTINNIISGSQYQNILLTSHAYFGLRKFLNLKNYVRWNNRRSRKSPPPVRFIGVGYKDKGSRKNTSNDGSQSWQEIASCKSFQSANDNPRKMNQTVINILTQWGLHPERLDF